MEQKILRVSKDYAELDSYLTENGIHSLLLVCGKSLMQLAINSYFDKLKQRLGIEIKKFDGFRSNPTYESVVSGVRLFREHQCDAIIAVGGGSAMDVAKCIKLYSNMEGDGSEGAFLRQTVVPNNIKLLAVPTTAGTGSEATRYAVVYYQSNKQSICHDSCIPEAVFWDSSALRTLPLYQKKATAVDALCHALESFWSVNSSDESRKYSREAIEAILRNMDGYLANTDDGMAGMQIAAYTAGKAINITQTTAGHAMCYKITSLFGYAHGHAAFLCITKLFPWMLDNLDKCSDPRGKGYLENIFEQIGFAMNCKSAKEAADKLENIFDFLEFEIPTASEKEFDILKHSVNPIRLKNNPISLDMDTIDLLYRKIMKGTK